MSNKKKKILYSITGIVAVMAVVVAAFAVPNAIISARDYRLGKQENHYTTSPIKITQERKPFSERLEKINDLIWVTSYVDINESDDNEMRFNMNPDEVWDESIECYYKLFSSKIKDGVHDAISYEEFKNKIAPQDPNTPNPMVFIDSESEETIYGWSCDIWSDSSLIGTIIIDDETGKLLGFFCDELNTDLSGKQLVDMSKLDIDDFGRGLAEYYGYNYVGHTEKKSGELEAYFVKLESEGKEIEIPLAWDTEDRASRKYIYYNFMSDEEISKRLK